MEGANCALPMYVYCLFDPVTARLLVAQLTRSTVPNFQTNHSHAKPCNGHIPQPFKSPPNQNISNSLFPSLNSCKCAEKHLLLC